MIVHLPDIFLLVLSAKPCKRLAHRAFHLCPAHSPLNIAAHGMAISNIVEDCIRRGFHLGERKKFLAEVFYGCSYMVKSIVYNQEAVMNIIGCAHIYRLILVIMPFYIQTQIIVNPLCIYSSKDSSIALVQQSQNCFIDIIVNKDDAFTGSFYEVADKNVCIEYLSIEKNALSGRQRCLKEEVDLASQVIEPFIMLQQAVVNAAFHIKKSLVDAVTSQ